MAEDDSSISAMAARGTCRACGLAIVWLRRPDGRWHPPVEPIDLDDCVTADANGVVQPIPQIFLRHYCDPDRMARLDEEKRRLIEASRSRREAEARAKEAKARAERFDRDLKYALRRFPKRFLQVPCRECDVEAGIPCRPRGKWHRMFLETPHRSRQVDAPLGRTPRRQRRWGKDYTGPWPPKENDPGRYEMRTWLAQNYTIFDPDGYREKDWLLPTEVVTLTQWLRTNARLLMNEEVKDGPGGVAGGSEPSPAS